MYWIKKNTAPSFVKAGFNMGNLFKWHLPVGSELAQ